ncbi:hypothetical protein C8R47DRAFT_573660 [Mycena vitilis]|nr:hypothetical protein C8R47DRAFT_573660 [Mycena vitilis]
MEPNNSPQTTEVPPRQRTWRALLPTAYTRLRQWIPKFSFTIIFCTLWVLWLLFGNRPGPDFSSPAAHIAARSDDCAVQTSILATYILPLTNRTHKYWQAPQDLILGAENLPYLTSASDRAFLHDLMSTRLSVCRIRGHAGLLAGYRRAEVCCSNSRREAIVRNELHACSVFSRSLTSPPGTTSAASSIGPRTQTTLSERFAQICTPPDPARRPLHCRGRRA